MDQNPQQQIKDFGNPDRMVNRRIINDRKDDVDLIATPTSSEFLNIMFKPEVINEAANRLAMKKGRLAVDKEDKRKRQQELANALLQLDTQESIVGSVEDQEEGAEEEAEEE